MATLLPKTHVIAHGRTIVHTTFTYHPLKKEQIISMLFSLINCVKSVSVGYNCSKYICSNCWLHSVLVFAIKYLLDEFKSNLAAAAFLQIKPNLLVALVESPLWLLLAFCSKLLGGSVDLRMVLCHSMNVG